MAGEMFAKAKRGITKAAHKAAAASSMDSFLDTLPVCPALEGLSQISIKLVDVTQVEDAIRNFVFGKNTEFEPIRFQLRDDAHRKIPILSATVIPQRGFVVHEMKNHDKEYLVVTLPVQSRGVFGKIQHPAGATLFKLCETREPDKMILQKTTNKPGQNLEILKVPKVHLQSLKMTSMLFDDQVFKLRRDGVSLVKIKPKAKSDTNTYTVTFTPACTDHQDKLTGIAVALLMTLHVAYEEVKNLLQESIKAE